MSTITQDPDYQSGYAFSLHNEYKEAISAFESAISRYPHEAEGYYQLGLARQKRAESIMPPSMREKSDGSSVAELASGLLGLGVLAVSKARGAGADRSRPVRSPCGKRLPRRETLRGIVRSSRFDPSL